MVLPALMIAMEKMNADSPDQKMRRAIVLLSLVTLLFCAFTVFAQYEGPDFIQSNPVFYLGIKSFFGR